MVDTIDDRVTSLERRVSEWEGQMGFLLPLTKQLHREVIAMNERLGQVEIKVDRLEVKVENLDAKVDRGFSAMLEQFKKVDERFELLEAQVEALPRAVAEIIAKK